MTTKKLRKIKKGIANPLEAIKYVLSNLYRTPVINLGTRYHLGTHVLDHEWDLLIILDTCRVDALRAVGDEYWFLDDIESKMSVGGTTFEWLAHTFDQSRRQALEYTSYITPHGWAQKILDNRNFPSGGNTPVSLQRLNKWGKPDVLSSDELGNFERVGRYLPNNTELECAKEFLEWIPEKYVEGRTPPRFVTDRAVAVGRNKNFNRQILHYVQPHAPYLANVISEKRTLKKHEENPFDYIKKTGDRESVWNTYLDELRWVLDDIELLLDNIDAEKVVISADHGEAFGEYGIYSHHTGSLHPHIRYVPWVTTSATDSESYQPIVEAKESANVSTEENLEALGYL